jgi:oligopeptide/dipeptide ABC transporter ATP-binding protein
MPTILDVNGLRKHFPVRRGILQRTVGTVRAVDDVSFQLARGETLGLVGESGCGKTTIARTVLQLSKPTAGHVVFEGRRLDGLSARDLRKIRPKMQMIFQDPYSSLNPRMNVGRLIGEPLLEHTTSSKAERKDRIAELMSIVGLDPGFVSRYPHEFSGGQQQRIGIARALALNPDLIICDEPTSALDVSIQAQIVNLLEDIQDRFELTFLFISHDLGMIRHMCDRVAVMYLGRIAEMGSGDDIYRRAQHPYTKALLSSVPLPKPKTDRERERIVLSGEIPSPTDPPVGCAFNTRCPHVEPRCRERRPELVEAAPSHEVACHLVATRC